MDVDKELGEKLQIRRCLRGGLELLWDGTGRGEGVPGYKFCWSHAR